MQDMPELAGMVVDHLQEHVVSAARTANPVPKQDVIDAFAARGVSLASVPDGVNYVHKCPAGPYNTVHMVMPERTGPVSVVYVADKPSTAQVDFNRGWHAWAPSSAGQGFAGHGGQGGCAISMPSNAPGNPPWGKVSRRRRPTTGRTGVGELADIAIGNTGARTRRSLSRIQKSIAAGFRVEAGTALFNPGF